jgi:hypothetical protein
MNVNASGRFWARLWLTTAMILSMGGNVAHACLAESDIHVALRIWPAALLPVFTFMGIEVLIRIAWERKFSWQSARALSLLPAIPAAIASYEHLGSLLIMMGERTFTAWTIPGAIDGAMIAGTVVLIVTRPRPASPAPAARESVTEEEADAIMAKREREWEEREAARIFSANMEEAWEKEIPSAPVSPAPTRTSIDQLSRSMAGVELLLAGKSPSKVARETGAGESTVYKWRKVLHTLQQDPNAPITEKISADLIEYMRESVREEANA